MSCLPLWVIQIQPAGPGKEYTASLYAVCYMRAEQAGVCFFSRADGAEDLQCARGRPPSKGERDILRQQLNRWTEQAGSASADE